MDEDFLLINKWFNWGILFIGVLGSLNHFIYDISNQLLIVGLISPVNESVWEHLKLLFFPTIIWWTIVYFALANKISINLEKWIVAGTLSILVGLIFIISWYYVTTKALNLEYTILDVFSFFFGVIITQSLGYHLYKYLTMNKVLFYISLLILIVLLSLFIIFTIKPPYLPLFFDDSKNIYGINRI